jgi:hypothetical protein
MNSLGAEGGESIVELALIDGKPKTSMDQSTQIIAFTHQILDQLLDFVRQHQGVNAPSYPGPGGSHLRHIIEHYETLTNGGDCLDYDKRARDPILETTASVAIERLLKIKESISEDLAIDLDKAVQVKGMDGLQGEYQYQVGSTVARELIFLASHAIHHCAILRPYCDANGIAVGSFFGIAPSTVAHQLATKN